MANAHDIIRAALRKIKAVSPDSDMTGAEAQDGLADLNRMLDSWSADGLMIYALTEEAFPLVIGQAEYTIGPTGNFNTTRPERVDGSSFIRDSNDQDFPLTVIPKEQYNAISFKTTRSIPEYICYVPEYPIGKVILYNAPDKTYTLRLVSHKPFTAFADLWSLVSFPSGYEEALIYNLAVRVASDYEAELSEAILALAAGGKAMIMSKNRRPLMAKISLPAGQRGNGNILTFGE